MGVHEPRMFGCERQAGLFGDRQGVDVGADGDDGAFAAGAELRP